MNLALQTMPKPEGKWRTTGRFHVDAISEIFKVSDHLARLIGTHAMRFVVDDDTKHLIASWAWDDGWRMLPVGPKPTPVRAEFDFAFQESDS